MVYFKKFKVSHLAFGILTVFLLTAVFSRFIANEKPLVCKGPTGIHWYWMGSHPNSLCEPLIHALICYDYNTIDDRNANFRSPFDDQDLLPGQQRHYMGTDQLGRDVAAGMVHGSLVALITGSFSMAIALIIGLLFGLFGAYYGNTDFRISRIKLIAPAWILFSGVYLLMYQKLFADSILMILGMVSFIVLPALLMYLVLKRIPWFAKKLSIPLDLLFSGFIEIFQSLPGSFLILILVSLFTKASIWNVILIIGLLRWPMIARYVRAEMLKIKEQRFIEASRAIGMTDLRIIFRHALPAALTPVIVAVAFGFSSAILLESALSFLGIGLPADHVSFGSMLNEARKNYEAWWMAVFPGMAIFLLVFSLNYIGDSLSRKIQGR